jgi:hypothetical protein
MRDRLPGRLRPFAERRALIQALGAQPDPPDL